MAPLEAQLLPMQSSGSASSFETMQHGEFKAHRTLQAELLNETQDLG